MKGRINFFNDKNRGANPTWVEDKESDKALQAKLAKLEAGA